MTEERGHWAWYASDGGEVYRVGPCASRDEVIAEATDEELGGAWWRLRGPDGLLRDGFFATADEAIDSHDGGEDLEPVMAVSFEICEAENPPLLLSDWFPDADWLLDHAEDQVADSDRVASECDEPPYFEGITPAQKADLEQSIKAAVNQWQDRHGLVFKVRTFAQMRNEETVTVILPPKDPAPGG